MSSGEDITDRKKVEEAPKESEERLRAIIENTHDVIYSAAPDGTLTYISPQAAAYGYEPEEIVGRSFVDFVHPDDVESVSRDYQRTIETGEGFPSVFRLVARDGSPTYIEEVGRAIVEAGKVVQVTGVLRDITERNTMEDELRQSNRRLQETLAELESTQKRVVQQERLAAVGQLAAGIAHDFNNLLTVMMGYSQLLNMREDIPDSVREDLNSITSQGQRAAQLIRQILDFSRKTAARRQQIDLLPFLKEAAQLFRRTLSETIRVVAVFDRDQYLVKANLTQLHQLFTTLSINAQDAMPAGGELRVGISHLTLDPEEEPPVPGMEGRRWVVLRVSDTGTGMEPGVLEHIYEPFFTTKKPGEGTGLGLSQVYGIVKQHNGEIAVQSEVGEGTTFTIYLPEVVTPEIHPKEPVPWLPGGRGEVILVVEDDTEVRDVMEIMLERLKYRAVTAGNGREALEVYDHHRNEIRLVLADMVMPEMGGVELFQVLKVRDPELPVLMMTAYPFGEPGKTLVPSGVAGTLEKPPSLRELAESVSQALKDRQEPEGT